MLQVGGGAHEGRKGQSENRGGHWLFLHLVRGRNYCGEQALSLRLPLAHRYLAGPQAF